MSNKEEEKTTATFRKRFTLWDSYLENVGVKKKPCKWWKKIEKESRWWTWRTTCEALLFFEGDECCVPGWALSHLSPDSSAPPDCGSGLHFHRRISGNAHELSPCVSVFSVFHSCFHSKPLVVSLLCYTGAQSATRWPYQTQVWKSEILEILEILDHWARVCDGRRLTTRLHSFLFVFFLDRRRQAWSTAWNMQQQFQLKLTNGPQTKWNMTWF